jgi:membrane-associated phospholipid phosphatase
MYSKSANIFGAIPSLHISYPALAMLFAFQLKSVRAFSTFFYVIMCFSAVYLNHHYILDVIWGSVYAVLIWWWTNLYANSKTTRELSDLKYDPLGPV